MRFLPSKTLLLFVVAYFLFFPNAHSEDLSVAIKVAPPFVYEEGGEWKGLSIDLLDQLSEEVGFTYTLFEQPSVNRLLIVTADDLVAMSVAAISLTPGREKVIDFSHPYFSTSMGILAKNKASPMENFLWMAQRLAVVFFFFVIALYVIGFVMDKVDGDDNIQGVNDGAWWALVTFTTTGYGDLVPKTRKGKLVGAGWMVASLFLISVFTGFVASSMTVKKLSETTTSLADLYDVDVQVVDGSTAELKLAELGIEYKTAPTLAAALNNFKTGKADAIVYDKAMLDYVSRDIDNVDVFAIDNSDEFYGIALPPKSKLKEQINLGILKILSTSKWKAAKAQYFGAE